MKRLSVVLIVVMLLTVRTNAFAVAECAHTIKSEIGSRIEYQPKSAGHIRKVITIYHCSQCGLDVEAETNLIYEGHEFERIRHGHLKNTNKHLFEYECIRCHIISAIEYKCSGPPCVNMNGHEDEIEVE